MSKKINPTAPSTSNIPDYFSYTLDQLKDLEKKATTWLQENKHDPNYPLAKTRYNHLVKVLNLKTPI